jgi:hypothetical protein
LIRLVGRGLSAASIARAITRAAVLIAAAAGYTQADNEQSYASAAQT